MRHRSGNRNIFHELDVHAKDSQNHGIEIKETFGGDTEKKKFSIEGPREKISLAKSRKGGEPKRILHLHLFR